MSAPLIVPAGNDRSMTRGMYTALNKIMRRHWWEENMDKRVSQAILDAVVYGKGYLTVKQEEKK